MEFADEERAALLMAVRSLAPVKVVESTTGERQLTFYSGKSLVTGPSREGRAAESEWLAARQRVDGRNFELHRNMQFIEVSEFGCGNISGHGSFCSHDVYYECEKWGTRDLRSACPVVPAPGR